MPIAYETHDNAPPAATGIVDAGLSDANIAAAPLADVVALTCFARDDANAVIGGAVGRTWGECCELQQLWVAPPYRQRGIGAALSAGGPLMTLWLGQDGFDYGFQADYARLWELEIAGIREVAEYRPECLISLEYKPNEPRAYSLLADCATTLLAIRAAGAPNLGVTIDFAHSLYADEAPAFAAMLAARDSRLLGVHLNDGNGKRDDGLMVASVHTLRTLELLREIRRSDYTAPLYFDTFPDLTGLDPVRECEVNIATVRQLLRVAEQLEYDASLAAALAAQDAVEALALVNRLLLAGPAGG